MFELGLNEYSRIDVLCHYVAYELVPIEVYFMHVKTTLRSV